MALEGMIKAGSEDALRWEASVITNASTARTCKPLPGDSGEPIPLQMIEAVPVRLFSDIQSDVSTRGFRRDLRVADYLLTPEEAEGQDYR